MVEETLLALHISNRCPKRPNPVMSVQALILNVCITLDACSFNFSITSIAFMDIPLIIKHPCFNDTDNFVNRCDTLAFFSDGKDAETNKMLYTLLDEEDSIYEKIVVCNSDGVGVYEDNAS